jgi:hypothetical protein
MSILGLGLWCLTPLSTIFQLCRVGKCYWWRKLEDPEKTTDEITVKLKLQIHVTLILIITSGAVLVGIASF